MSTIQRIRSDRRASDADRDWLLILLFAIPLFAGIVGVFVLAQKSSADWEQHPELMSSMSP